MAKLDRAHFNFNEDGNARLSALMSNQADVFYRPPVDCLSTLEQDENFHLDSVVSLRLMSKSLIISVSRSTMNMFEKPLTLWSIGKNS